MVLNVIPPRQRTREHLFGLIEADPGITRRALGQATGMSQSAVANAVSQLIAEGRVTEDGITEGGPGSGSGRPATRLTVALGVNSVAALDFGHNHVSVALADGRGNITAARHLRLSVDINADAAMRAAATAFKELLAETGFPTPVVVVAGIPGPIDATTGRIISPTILSGWVDRHPARELADLLGIHVHAENDAHIGSYGELRRGVGNSHDDFLYVKASSGIGSALVQHRQVHRGATGVAGEIGHTALPNNYELCRCGRRGCLEAVVSFETVARQLSHAHPELSDAIDAHDLLNLDDLASDRILNDAGRTVGNVLGVACNLINPSALVLGGELGVRRAFVDGVRSSVNRMAQPTIAQAMTVTSAHLGLRTELVGAVEMAVTLARKFANQSEATAGR